MLADSSRESFAILSLPWNLHRSLVVLALFLQESATWQSRTSSLATGQLDSLKLPKLYVLWRYNQMYDLFRILFKVHKNYFPRSLRQFLPSTSSLFRQKWHRNHPPLRTPSNLAWIISEDSLSVLKPSMVMMGRDGRPVQRTRRRFSIREASKQIKSWVTFLYLSPEIIAFSKTKKSEQASLKTS